MSRPDHTGRRLDVCRNAHVPCEVIQRARGNYTQSSARVRERRSNNADGAVSSRCHYRTKAGADSLGDFMPDVHSWPQMDDVRIDSDRVERRTNVGLFGAFSRNTGNRVQHDSHSASVAHF
jgi:hypothetical protein